MNPKNGKPLDPPQQQRAPMPQPKALQEARNLLFAWKTLGKTDLAHRFVAGKGLERLLEHCHYLDIMYTQAKNLLAENAKALQDNAAVLTELAILGHNEPLLPLADALVRLGLDALLADTPEPSINDEPPAPRCGSCGRPAGGPDDSVCECGGHIQ